ncbi:helix-turn-helix domain-containing protein [Sorangium sp. So ce341]|uniref:helix-turn-helix domain-containing protein n=1 Tax=Sorangium sp. So ce341 TaxID=3133302 RepID=UPI003F5D6C1F
MSKEIQSLPFPQPPAGSLAERVALMLEKRQMSQHGLEGEAKLSRGYVSRILKGERMKLSPEMMRRIADALEVSYEWLATGRGDSEGTAGTSLAAPIAARQLSHPLEAAIAYHRGKWSAPTVAAARAFATSPEAADLEPPEWADVLDQIDAALSKIKLTGRRRPG